MIMQYNLLENFYSEIASTYTSENCQSFNSTIELNPDHEIYKGHFPQIPVAPGVCLIQAIKEILMVKLQTKLILTEGSNIKFLILINPKETKQFQVDFIIKRTDSILDVSANYTNNAKIFLKFKGTFNIA
ncbi:MAG: hydroxymyristoyl-ACP dehydratase [Bacteroidota bacterium]